MAQKIIPDIFKNARDGMVTACAESIGPAREGDVIFSDFQIEGEWFTVMDSAVKQDFTFDEAVSFAILCSDQEEIAIIGQNFRTILPMSNVDDARSNLGYCARLYPRTWRSSRDVLVRLGLL